MGEKKSNSNKEKKNHASNGKSKTPSSYKQEKINHQNPTGDSKVSKLVTIVKDKFAKK